MISTPALNALRKPVQSLQETCSSLFGGGRKRAVNPTDGNAQASNAGEASRYDATQWAPTHWAETSLEPRLP